MSNRATPPYGTLFFSAPGTTAGDKRYMPVNNTNYTTVADASFADAFAHQFTGSSAIYAEAYLRDVGADGSGSPPIYIELDDGNEVRVYFELELDASSGQTNGVTFKLAGGIGEYGIETNTTIDQVRQFVIDRNGTRTNGAWKSTGGTGTKNEVELRLRRTWDGANWILTCEMRFNGTTQETITHTISGADKTFRIIFLKYGHPAGTGKSIVYDHRFGRIWVGWNQTGTPYDRDQTWFRDWAPTVTARQVPTSDINAADWTPSTGTSRYALLDEASFDATDYDSVYNQTAEKNMLLGWPAVGALGARPIVILHNQKYHSGEQSTLMQWVASGTLESTSEAVRDGTVVEGIQTPGIFHNDPDGGEWTEANINATNFGLRKPASAAGEYGDSAAMWRYVLSGGAAVTSPILSLSPVIAVAIVANVTLDAAVVSATTFQQQPALMGLGVGII